VKGRVMAQRLQRPAIKPHRCALLWLGMELDPAMAIFTGEALALHPTRATSQWALQAAALWNHDPIGLGRQAEGGQVSASSDSGAGDISRRAIKKNHACTPSAPAGQMGVLRSRLGELAS